MRTHDLLMTIACLAATVCGASHLRTGARADERVRETSQECTIDGSVYEVGALNPDNVCQACAPSDPTAWSPASEGLTCSDNHTCHRGRCWRVLRPLDRYNRMMITLLDGMTGSNNSAGPR